MDSFGGLIGEFGSVLISRVAILVEANESHETESVKKSSFP